MKIKPLNDGHRLNIGISLGLAASINYLRGEREIYAKLPGFNTALALIEVLEAQQRANVAGMNFRAAVAAGVDITTHMIGMAGRGEIYAEPMDLTELADFSASVDRSARQGGETREAGLDPKDESAVPAEQGDAQPTDFTPQPSEEERR